jgi:tetratricopeptide (TPR) repeat protein
MLTRALLFGLCAGTAILAARPAAALTETNRETLEKYFRSKGEVRFELYAPFGGPEVGVAVYESGGRPQLEAVMQAGKGKGSTKTLLSEGLSALPDRQPFTLLQSGAHLLTYTPESSGSGRGTLQIRDLSSDAPKMLLEIHDAPNLSFQPGNSPGGESLIWQVKPTFLNEGGRLPVKHTYAKLIWDPAAQTYTVHQPLQALADDDTLEAANLNNRAIIYYNLGMLSEAAKLLDEAAMSAEYDQSVILHNKEHVDSEIEDFAKQSRMKGVPFDDALMYFFQGEYAACLRIMKGRELRSNIDVAMVGLALAGERRWPESDKYTEELFKRRADFLGEYVSMLINIARSQGFVDIAASQLKKLESADPKNPYFVAELARLMVHADDPAGAKRLLERCIYGYSTFSPELGPASQLLFDLCRKNLDTAGCERLTNFARQPMSDLQAYASLADFYDLSSAMLDVERDLDTIPYPDQPLENLVLPGTNIDPNAHDVVKDLSDDQGGDQQ